MGGWGEGCIKGIGMEGAERDGRAGVKGGDGDERGERERERERGREAGRRWKGRMGGKGSSWGDMGGSESHQ